MLLDWDGCSLHITQSTYYQPGQLLKTFAKDPVKAL